MASPPLKVVHLLQGLEVGGLEMMVTQLILRMDPERYAIQVIGYDSLGPLATRLGLGGVPCRLLKRRPGVDWRYILRLAWVLQRIRPSVLHLHNPTAFFYGALAGFLARIPCVIYTEHGRDFASSKRNRYLHRFLARLTDRIVVVAEASRTVLEEEGVPGNKIVTLHNGVDAARFILGSNPWTLREKLDFSPEQPLVGIVARLDPIKNHPSLLRAWARVIQERPEARLLVIGDGPSRSALEQLTGELGIANAVRFLGVRDDVPELLALVDVAVLCSQSEGLSITLLEESAAGKAIVATAVGGNGEVIEDGCNGLLVPSGDDDALASAILGLLANPEQARTMGQAARQRFTQEFTLERMTQRYTELYLGCLAERRVTPAYPATKNL